MMKFKFNQMWIYDCEGFKKWVVCLCFWSEQEDEVLLVSSSWYLDQWIVLGGGMEFEEEFGGVVVREVYEEVGVKGKLGRFLGIFEN